MEICDVQNVITAAVLVRRHSYWNDVLPRRSPLKWYSVNISKSVWHTVSEFYVFDRLPHGLDNRAMRKMHRFWSSVKTNVNEWISVHRRVGYFQTASLIGRIEQHTRYFPIERKPNRLLHGNRRYAEIVEDVPLAGRRALLAHFHLMIFPIDEY